MNEKTLGWLATAFTLYVAAWTYKSGQLTEQQWQIVVIVLLILGITYRIFTRRMARKVVIQRRRSYKELWRRFDKLSQGGKKPKEEIFTEPEENLIVLLGRIKGARLTMIFNSLAILASLFFSSFFALALAIWQFSLAFRLHLIARSLSQTTKPDSQLEPPDVLLPQSSSKRYLIEVDLRKIHDFIKPTHALPFWDFAEAESWLLECGYKKVDERMWEVSDKELIYLDKEEIITIKPAKPVSQSLPRHKSETHHQAQKINVKAEKARKRSIKAGSIPLRRFNMISRGYRLMLVVLIPLLWLGIFHLESDDKLLLTLALLGGITIAMWVDTIIVCGIRSLRIVPYVAQITLKTRRSSILVGILVINSMLWLSPFIEHPHPYRYYVCIILGFTVLLLCLQPPFVLLLGASRPGTGDSLRSVSLTTFPLRVVALLNLSRTGRFPGTFSFMTDDLRTSSDYEWREIVDKLVNFVPLIVLDARFHTKIVEEEARLILSSKNRIQRTWFVVEPNGDAPVLTAPGVKRSIRGLRIITIEEINSKSFTRLIAELSQNADSVHYQKRY